MDLKKIGKSVVTAVASVLLVAYIIYHIFLSYGATVGTFSAELTESADSIALQAYVLRDEKPVYAPADRNINYLISNGARVAKDSRLAAAYAGKDVQQEVERLDSQIAVLQKSDLGENIALADTASIDAKLNALVLRMQRNIQQGNLDYVLRQKSEMQVLINKRMILVNRLSGLSDRIEALEAQKNELLVNDPSQVVYLTSPASGYFYTDVDGYETLFDATDVSSMTLSSFREMVQSEPKTQITDDSGQIAVGKVVDSFTWYLACPTTAAQASVLTLGKNYEMAFPYSNGQKITMALERVITEPESEDAVLIFSTNTVLSDMNFVRSQSVELVIRSFSGYRVPVSAVRMVEGKQGVYTLVGSVVRYREIEVLFEADGYYTVEAKDGSDEDHANRLGQHDLIIVKGRDLYDGKIID